MVDQAVYVSLDESKNEFTLDI